MWILAAGLLGLVIGLAVGSYVGYWAGIAEPPG